MAIENDIERVFDSAGDTFGSLTHFVHSSGIIGDNSRLDDASSATIRRGPRHRHLWGTLVSSGPVCGACPRNMAVKGGAVVMLSLNGGPARRRE